MYAPSTSLLLLLLRVYKVEPRMGLAYARIDCAGHIAQPKRRLGRTDARPNTPNLGHPKPGKLSGKVMQTFFDAAAFAKPVQILTRLSTLYLAWKIEGRHIVRGYT